MEQWLQSPVIVTAIVSLLSLIGAFIGVVWALGGWKGRVEERLNPLSGFGEWKGTVNAQLEALTKLLAEVRADVRGLVRELPKDTVGTSSPTRLKDLGKEVAAELQAEEWARTRAGTLGGDVAGMQAYEVDTFAFDYVYGELRERDAGMSTRASKCAYERGISRDNVLAVLQVVLRDALIDSLGSKEGV